MCYSVYIATNQKLEEGSFVPNETDIFFSKISDAEEVHLRSKFSKENIYYVGSDTNCSCGLALDSSDFENPEEEINKKSSAKFIEFLQETTLIESVQCYCCWEGDEGADIENYKDINIQKISFKKNYFSLEENVCITFIKTYEPKLRNEIVKILQENEQGSLLKAIKFLRNKTKSGLMDARIYVEYLAIDLKKSE
ncbi:hypothetical protein V9L05_12455 [Bernardetia sp. Wsw4-3y2]|uniref:hypothetical protein n=1 Tax=Bernardetia sp. Wsw4-3y2 TaxID=3127471 RepID=UPI0030D4B076